LTISSKEINEDVDNEEIYTRKEFNYNSFSRSFTLPDIVDIEKIGAKHENGILKIYLQKKEEAKLKPIRNIEIK